MTLLATAFPGLKVQSGAFSFHIVCGPNASRSAVSRHLGAHQAAYPQFGTVEGAAYSYRDTGGPGDDVISVSGVVGGTVQTTTVSVDWSPPVDCMDPASKLGWVAALECKVKAAHNLIETIKETGDCAVGVLSFLAPAAKLAKLFADADKLRNATILAKDAGTGTPLARLIIDMEKVRAADGLAKFTALKQALLDAKDLPDFLTDIAAFTQGGGVSQIALDVADLTGLKSCVNLMAKVVSSRSSAGGGVQPVVVPTAGPTLVDTESSAGNVGNGDTSFDDFGRATGQGVVVRSTLPRNLSGFRCTILDLNTALGSSDILKLKAFLGAGGTVLALGEHQDSGADLVGFNSADAELNSVVAALGASGMSLNDDSIGDGDGDDFTSDITAAPLTLHVGTLAYNWVSSLTVADPASTLVFSNGDELPLVAFEPVAAGDVVLSGDSNMFNDNNDGFFQNADNGVFAADLCP